MGHKSEVSLLDLGGLEEMLLLSILNSHNY